jgi:hypothetical protein
MRAGGVGDADLRQQFDGPLAHGTTAEVGVVAQRLADLRADPVQRIEARHRVLEDHGDARAAHAAHLRFIERQQIGAVEIDAAGQRKARVGAVEADDRAGRDRLAAAGLADDAEDLAGREAERHIVHQARRLPSRVSRTLRPRTSRRGSAPGGRFR